jgi:hypothetical protein
MEKTYESLLPEANALKPELIRVPHMPVDRLIQKASTVLERFFLVRALFATANFNGTLVEKLPLYLDGLRYAESACAVVFPNHEDTLLWEAELERAYFLRNKLITGFRLAFRNDEALLSKLSDILVGNDQANFIQDFSDFALLGNTNVSLLTAINFDTVLLVEAEEKPKLLSKLLARATINRDGSGPQYEIRNRFFALVKSVTDEIEAYAEYVFADTPVRIDDFKIRYTPRVKKKNSTLEPVTT